MLSSNQDMIEPLPVKFNSRHGQRQNHKKKNHNKMTDEPKNFRDIKNETYYKRPAVHFTFGNDEVVDDTVATFDDNEVDAMSICESPKQISSTIFEEVTLVNLKKYN